MNTLWENFFSRTKDQTVKSILKKNILFQDLNPREISIVESIVNIRHFRPGEVIFRQGDVGVGMYIIVSGKVSVYFEQMAATPEQIQSDVMKDQIALLSTHDFFGDLALVEPNSRRSASAVASEDCTLIGFFKPDLVEISDRIPAAGVKILWRLSEVIGTRLRETLTKVHHREHWVTQK